jgi:hypothetical protein
VAIAEVDQSKDMARMHEAIWFTLRHDFIDWFGSLIEPSTIVTNHCQLSIALGRISVQNPFNQQPMPRDTPQ